MEDEEIMACQGGEEMDDQRRNEGAQSQEKSGTQLAASRGDENEYTELHQRQGNAILLNGGAGSGEDQAARARPRSLAKLISAAGAQPQERLDPLGYNRAQGNLSDFVDEDSQEQAQNNLPPYRKAK